MHTVKGQIRKLKNLNEQTEKPTESNLLVIVITEKMVEAASMACVNAHSVEEWLLL